MGCSGISRYPMPEAGAASGYNLVLITLDTTRPEFLSIYDESRATPAFGALMDRGVCFTQAFTSVPHTLPAQA